MSSSSTASINVNSPFGFDLDDHVPSKSDSTEGIVDGGEDTEAEGAPSPPAKKAKLRRAAKACVACRGFKMKCIDVDNPPCVRCRKSGLQCTFLEGKKKGRKPKIRTDPALLPALKNSNQAHILHQPAATSLHPFSNNSFTSVADSNQPAFFPLAGPSTALATPTVSFSLPPRMDNPSPSIQSTAAGSSDKGLAGSNPSAEEPWTLSHVNLKHPLGVLADAAQSQARSAEKPEASHEVGIASESYFRGGRKKGLEGTPAPPGVMRIIDPNDMEPLFKLFFQHLHVHTPWVDREHTTPEATALRSPYLFNAIICISARYWDRPDLALKLREFARLELEKIPTEKSLESVQGQLLHCVFNLSKPADSFEADLLWVRLGIAMRMSLDLNLHRPSPAATDTVPEWRLSCARRTWLSCYIMDKNLSAQLGKPSVFWLDAAVSHVPKLPIEWCVEDSRVYAQLDLTHVVTRGLDTMRYHAPKGEAASELPAEFLVMVERQLDDWRETWIATGSGLQTEEERQARRIRMALNYHYGRLLIASVGLQASIKDNPSYLPFALAKHQTASISVLNVFRDDLRPSGTAKYLTDLQYNFVLYGAVSLIKSVQSPFPTGLVDRNTVGLMVNAVANGLEEVAACWDHLPALQSRFLRRVLESLIPEYRPPVQPSASRPRWARFGGRSGTATPLPQPFTMDNNNNMPFSSDALYSAGLAFEPMSFEPMDIEREFFQSTMVEPMLDWPDFWETSEEMGM